MQNLDDFSKILIATGNINYVANALSTLLAQRKMLTGDNKEIQEINAEMEAELADTVEQLSGIYERLLDHMNDRDAVCEIDVRLSKVPCEILLEGMDEVCTEY